MTKLSKEMLILKTLYKSLQPFVPLVLLTTKLSLTTLNVKITQNDIPDILMHG